VTSASPATRPRPSEPQSSRLDKLGLEISSLDASVANGWNEGCRGVVVTNVREGSPADRAGLQGGMLITQVNRHPVKTVDEAKQAIDASEANGVLLLVRTADGSGL